MALYKVTKKQEGGGSTSTVFSVNASHTNNPTTYDIVVTTGGTTVFSKNYSCTVYGAFAQDTDTFTYNGTTYMVLAQGYQANNGQKMLDFSIDDKSYSVYCSTGNSSYATDVTFTVIVGGGGSTEPKIVYANSANRRSLVTFTYTFAESGTFQYYFLVKSNSEVASSSGTITLNNTTITPTFDNTKVASMGFFYGEVEVDVGDVLEFKTVSTESNMGTQVFILQNADITAFNCIGTASNNGATFDINLNDKPYLHVYQCGYFSGNNIFHYEIGKYGTTSIAVPNISSYYYGLTYVIQLVPTS